MRPNRYPDPSPAVAIVALPNPHHTINRRFALVITDGKCITFAQANDARAPGGPGTPCRGVLSIS